VFSEVMTSFSELYSELSTNNPTDPFGKEGWQHCSAKSLRGHIANAHFQARTLADIGVPLYDIEIAEVRDIGLGWVVKRAFEKITRENKDIQAEIDDHCVADRLSVPEYRLRLVKSIHTIANKGLADVPWDKIDAAYPDASQVSVDLAVDTTDASSKTMIREHRKPTYGSDIGAVPMQKYVSLITPIDSLSAPADPAYTVNI
jgi:hypothetical protein